MPLSIQIFSLLYSFGFGLIFGIVFRKLTGMPKYVSIILGGLLYFGGLYLINDGIIHYYFIIMLSIGFLIYKK